MLTNTEWQFDSGINNNNNSNNCHFYDHLDNVCKYKHCFEYCDIHRDKLGKSHFYCFFSTEKYS